MIAQEHIQTAYEFLDGSDREFEAGDILQGSEKLWGAFSHAITAIAKERGWQYGSHRLTLEAGKRLVMELNDLSIAAAVSEANVFHKNFYNNFMEDYEIEVGRSVVRAFVERILALDGE
jgi:hypothetical protein